MKNYNEIIKNLEKWEEVKTEISNYNNDINDNVDCILDETTVKNAVEKVNNLYETLFTNAFIGLLENDRKTAFIDLIKNPSFTRVNYKKNENGTFTVDETKKATFDSFLPFLSAR